MATVAPTAPPSTLAADTISYEDLYARWERNNWSATELDFSEDARQWRERFSPFERQAALWNYALFFWGEDAVADTLSPYIDAAPRGGCCVKVPAFALALSAGLGGRGRSNGPGRWGLVSF